MNPAKTMVLALNLGSATLKAAHYHHQHAGAGSTIVPHGARFELPIASNEGGAADPVDLLERVAALLADDGLSPDTVAHRIVHGGARVAPAVLTDEVFAELSGYAQMAPLHQPAALRLAQSARTRWPDARHVAVFDTAWHSTLASWSRRLPVPQALHDAGVMRYGFHGLAFQSAMRQLATLDHTAGGQRIVLAHLGSGCSLCAVANGRSIDTTMGMTPLDGLPMATRSGSLDPGVVFLLERQLKMSTQAIEQMLWRESGLLGVSGRSSDIRQLLDSPDVASSLAVDQFVMRVAQGIAAMATSLGGMDAIVFSGGIGTHAPIIRQRVVDRLLWAGLRLDSANNSAGAVRLDAQDSAVKIWTLKVDEEMELAEAAIECSPPTTKPGGA